MNLISPPPQKKKKNKKKKMNLFLQSFKNKLEMNHHCMMFFSTYQVFALCEQTN